LIMLNIILLGITSLLTDISSEMVYPILPVYLVTRLGAGPAVLGVIEGIAESLASLLKVFSGHFSDTFRRRKPFAVIGYACSGVGKVFLYAASGWGHILAGRIIDRFGKGIRTAPRDALIAESTPAGKRGAAFGLHRSMDTLGAAIGVTVAYFLVTAYKGEMKEIFLISLVPAFLAVTVLFFVREKREHKSKPLAPKRFCFQWAGLDRRLKFFLIFTFIFTLGNSSNQFLLLRAKDAGAGIQAVLLFYLVYNITYTLFAYPAARLSDRIGKKNLLVAGYLFYGLVYLGFALNTRMEAFWLLFVLYGAYMGITEGIEKALIADIAPADSRATIIGMHASLVGLGLFPASVCAGFLWKFLGGAAPFYFGGILGIVASIGLAFILKGL